jgi:adhesin transport system outer membrane protein
MVATLCRLSLAALLSLAAAGAAQAETVKEAVESALATNPEARTAEANRRAAGQGLNQARGGYLPTLDALAEGGREHTKGPNLGTQDLNRRDGSLILRQYVFDGFQVTYEVERQTSLVGSATWRVEETRLSLAQRVMNAYLDVLRNDELVRLARDTVKAHEAHVEKTRLRLKQGVGPRADVQQAEGRLALAISTLVNQEGSLREAGTAYFKLVGRMPVEPVKPLSPAGALPPTVKQALEKASAGHPNVKAAQADAAAAESAAAGSKSTLVPRLDLELRASSNVDTAGIEGTRNDASAMLVMKYNLFRGGSDLARTRQLAELQRSSEETLNNARLVVEEEVGRSWIALNTAREALAYLAQRVQSSEQVLEAYRLQFELARRTLIDLLNAEAELFQAKSGQTNGQYAVLQSEYRVLASTGELVSALGISPVSP